MPPLQDLWKSEPDRFAYNRCEPRAAFVSQKTRVISLDGTWRFHEAPSADAPVDPRFLDAEDPCDDWRAMPVPAHPELHGVGAPQYVNQIYPWDGLEDVAIGDAPRQTNRMYEYVRTFTLAPEDLAGPMRLRLDGASSCAAVWVNGREAGYAEDSFSPAEYDIAPYARAGRNKLAVRVARFCAGSWLEDQDFWRLSGIFRPVRLLLFPNVHIVDFHARYRYDYAARRADIRLTVKTSRDARVTAALRDGANALAAVEGRAVVRVLGAHMGVGGDDSWSSAPHAQYLLAGDRDFSFSFTLKGIKKGEV